MDKWKTLEKTRADRESDRWPSNARPLLPSLPNLPSYVHLLYLLLHTSTCQPCPLNLSTCWAPGALIELEVLRVGLVVEPIALVALAVRAVLAVQVVQVGSSVCLKRLSQARAPTTTQSHLRCCSASPYSDPSSCICRRSLAAMSFSPYEIAELFTRSEAEMREQLATVDDADLAGVC